jgi:predicted polyphosphate/ATP-dependent NAD kinase
MKKIGVVVNPIAGMGGKVGLKGTDGHQTLQKAIERNAEPIAPARAICALQELESVKDQVQVLSGPKEMGEFEALEAGLKPVVVGTIKSGQTDAEDTKSVVSEFLNKHVDLILFTGGDGTARDVFSVVDQEVPVLGIPSGVKLHSSVFGLNPKKAGQLAVFYLQGNSHLREGEVMDVDEEAFRENRLSARLYGYLLVPFEKRFVQETKSSSPSTPDEKAIQKAIADYLVGIMDSSIYILGPGTTIRAVAEALDIKKTLLGVDVIKNGRLLCKDANESDLLRIIDQDEVKIVVTPIGGQGFIFGRGNQQISSEIIRKVGRKNLIVLATPNKLLSVGVGAPLRVDTGDSEIDQMLSGYLRVITGPREEAVVKVES